MCRGELQNPLRTFSITMPSQRRQLWIPLNVGWIAFAAGYLLASGGFSPSRKPVAGLPLAQTPAPVFTPVAASTPMPFRWSQLESTDYATYIANLRAVGCPEQTLHDIIAGDLASVYAQKRQSQQAAQAQAPAEVQAQARQTLDQEERRLLNTLLEPSPTDTPSNSAASAPASTFSLSPSEGQTPVSVASAGQSSNTSAAGASAVSPASAASSAAPAATEQAASSATAATTGSDTSASNTTAAANRTNRWKSPFTPEEEAYRTKWGWQAFDAAQRAANRAGN